MWGDAGSSLSPFCWVGHHGALLPLCTWLFLWLGQDQFSLFLCSSSPSSLLYCCEILSPSTIFAYFQDVFTLVIHSAKYFSVYIYLDAQTIQLAMGMSL